jgi:ubiquinone/menaquinone biosynthesis C-methylase UbiE
VGNSHLGNMSYASAFKHALGGVHGGRVLDVATGTGGFIPVLQEYLAGWDEIVGIDTKSAPSDETAPFSDDSVSFAQMSADSMTFPDETFDTVTISNSLHHLPDTDRSLHEMFRVLKPGGHIIVHEMYRDNQTDAQMTHVLLHDWWGQVDTACSIHHDPTYTRTKLLQIVDRPNLRNVMQFDHFNTSEDPFDPAVASQLEDVIDAYIVRASQTSTADTLRRVGETMRDRLHAMGFHPATSLIVTGRKA